MDATTAIENAIKSLGGAAQVARLRQLKTRWGVAKWMRDGLPAEHVLWLAEQTDWKFTPHALAPYLYPHPDDGLPQERRAKRTRAAPPAAPLPPGRSIDPCDATALGLDESARAAA